LTNSGVETTLRQFQDMERLSNPRDLLNWRLQQALYRAYYDAHVRDRLIHETALESQAMDLLRQAPRLGSLVAIDQAEGLLKKAVTHPVSTDRRMRVHELAEALFQSIRMQLDVSRYRAIAVGRGASLDTLDVPLNNRVWLERQFAELRALPREPERLRGIDALLNRNDPGPGGFYDDLGDPAHQPHLVRRSKYAQDPDFRRSSLVGFGTRPGWPMFWSQNAQSLYDAPLEMRYDGLDPEAHYRVRVAYTGDNFQLKIQLDADGLAVHPLIKKPDPSQPIECDVPAKATEDSQLTLRWRVEPGRGGNGRGCQVGEVWLIKK
jgi:hypothetical protein